LYLSSLAFEIVDVYYTGPRVPIQISGFPLPSCIFNACSTTLRLIFETQKATTGYLKGTITAWYNFHANSEAFIILIVGTRL
jgi:hypothetical protein